MTWRTVRKFLLLALLLLLTAWWMLPAGSADSAGDKMSDANEPRDTASASGQGQSSGQNAGGAGGSPLSSAMPSSGSGRSGSGTNAPVLLQWGKVITTEPAAQAASRALRASPNPVPVQRLSGRGTVPWLVQFNDVIREEWKTEMQATGAQLKGYIPENAFLVEASPAQIVAIGRMAQVQWVGEYVPEYKKAGAVRRKLSTSSGELDEYNLILLDPADVQKVAAQVAGFPGAVVVKSGPMADRGLVQAKLTPAAVGEVAALGEIEWIEPYLKPQLWNNVAVGSSRMDVSNVWTNLGLTGQGQTVAVLDSGLDSGNTATIHPDFTGRVTGFGWRNGAYNATNSWADTDGHGTHVAGSVLGSGAASTNTFRGIAYQANLIAQGAQADLSGIATDWRPILQQAFTNGARVHNNSWGYDDNGAYNSSARNLDIYMWTNKTMVVIVAAGNQGIDANSNGVVDPTSIGSPASAKNCIAVGAAENFRSSGGLAGRTWGSAWPADYPVNPIRDDRISLPETPQGMAAFSSRGPLLDGRIKPDIVAPGTDIISTKSRQSSDTAWGSHPNTNYMYSGGTSMASPLVAGAAALTRQWLIQSNGFTNPSAALVKAVLLNGARNMAPGQYGTGATQEIPTQRPNNVTGWGHVDLYDSLVALTNSVRQLYDSGSLATGQANTFNYSVGAATTNKFIITMAYTDYFPAIGAGKQLVNDLDLTVTKPSGAVVYANGGSALDNTNNVETIEFVPDEIGNYTVRVSARTVPQGTSQPYSLVVVAPLTAAPVITSAATASGTLGQSFSYQITANASPTSFGASGLPPGLSVNTSTGLISGTPTTTGIYNATITATNAAGTGQATLAITITRAREAVFSESMGSATTTTAIANHTFQNTNLTFSGTADVRNTTASSGYSGATGLGNVFFTSNGTASFLISGINTLGFTDLALTLGHYKNSNNANNELIIEVSADGDSYSALSYTRSTGSGTSSWILLRPTGQIPATENLRIRLSQTSSLYQFRVDDVILTGVPPPRPTIVSAATTSSGETEIDGATTYQVVRGTSTSVSVTASDEGGEGSLTYTWSATGGAVTFSPNGTNAAKSSTAIFPAAGNYTLTVSVRNAEGGSATSSVPVRVKQPEGGQTITFDEINDQLATNVLVLSATASSGLPVTFSLDSGPAILDPDGVTLSFTGEGVVSVTASQAGNESYPPAFNVTRSFSVSKATPQVFQLPQASDILPGQPLNNSVLSGGLTDVPGSFGWLNPAIVPPVGVSTQEVLFTPFDTDRLSTAKAMIDVNVVAPVMSIAPSASQSFVLSAGETTNFTLSVINSGNAPLEWTIDATTYDFRDDTEQGTNGWVVYGDNATWHRSTNRPFSGATSWYSGVPGSAVYSSNSEAYAELPWVHLHTNAPRLRFRHWTDIEQDSSTIAWDGGLVGVIDQAGNFYFPGTTKEYTHRWYYNTNILVFSGTFGWREAEFDLSAFAGQPVKIVFVFVSDEIIQQEGWYIDDVAISPREQGDDWLIVSPLAGTVPALSTNEVTVTVSAASLAPGAARTGDINVRGNDPENPTAALRVNLSLPKAPATIGLGNLLQSFDGQPKRASVTTSPAGLTVDVTYNGSTTPPTASGSYAVEATVDDASYTGSATGTLSIVNLEGAIEVEDSIGDVNDSEMPFGLVDIGDAVLENITIRNTNTTSDLTITDIRLTGSGGGAPSEAAASATMPAQPAKPRLSPRELRAAALASTAEREPESIIVKFKPEAAALPLRAALHAGLGSRQLRAFDLLPADVVELPAGETVEDMIAAYEANDAVEYAEPNFIYTANNTPNDPGLTNSWGLHNTGQSGGTAGADISALEAWARTTGSTNVIVAVIDTGIDYNHPDLAANMWVNPNPTFGDVHGARFIGGNGLPTSGDPMDDQGHGTHVAGTIGAVGNNGIGVAGVNWNVKLMALKFITSANQGSTADAIACIEYAIENGAHLSNNSWGGGGYSQALKDAIDAAGRANQLFVAAAGNDGTNNDVAPHYPSNYDSPNVIAVANSTRTDARSSTSNYGTNSVHLAAPGSTIYSTMRNNSYGNMSGTSMAAPHVAGVAALLLARHPDAPYADVRRWILDSVDVLPSWASLVQTSGRLSAEAALANAQFGISVTNGFPIVLPPGEDVILPVRYLPTRQEEAFDTIVISNNDVQNPRIEIALSGRGGAPPVITSPLSASAVLGELFSYQITADNTPTSFAASGLPPGLSLDTGAGIISGHPTVPGTYPTVIEAINEAGSGQATLTIAVRHWIDDQPFALLVTNPGSPVVTSNGSFAFAGLSGPNITGLLSWSNRLTGQVGTFGKSGPEWGVTVPLAAGTNTLDFRGSYEVQEGADSGASSDYADGWTSGDNGGSVFLPWQLQTGPGGDAFVAPDTISSPDGRLFGLWSGTASSALATRPFPALSGGGAVSLEFRNSGLSAAGRMGFEFADAQGNPRLVFHSAARGGNYRIHDSAGTNTTGWTNDGAGFAALQLLVDSADGYTLRLDGSELSGALLPGGAVAQVRIFSEAAAETPTLVASDKMQYPAGSSLANQSGGTGFSASWFGGDSMITADSQPFPAWVRLGTSASTRILSSPVTTGVQPVYLSMVIRSADFTAGNFSGFALTDSGSSHVDRFFVGIPWTRNAFGVDRRQSWDNSDFQVISNLPTSTPHLVVCGLIPGVQTNMVDVKLWTSTNTSQDLSALIEQSPAISFAGAQGKTNFTFNQIKLHGDFAGAMEFAEVGIVDIPARTDYELLFRNLRWESAGAMVSAPSVWFNLAKTDGLPDAWWDAHGIPAASRLADGDYDLDGLNNAMEYFMALDPGVDDAAAAVAQQVTADQVVFDYRRSKSLNGVSGTVKWTSALGDAAVWSTDSVTDVLLSEDEVHEWRRATVPWSPEQGELFLRIDLTIE